MHIPQTQARPIRIIASLAVMVAALVTVIGAGPTSNANAEAPVLPATTRIDGADRYAVAVKASSTGFTSANIVYIASGEKFADALSATSVAARHQSPLLLTPAASLPSTVAAEVSRLRPATIVVVGGSASVSDAVIDQLTRSTPGATVIRVGGADRYEVSRNLIADPLIGAGTSTRVMIATGANFPDALSASPAAALINAPVLLVDGAKASPSDAEKALITHLGAASATIVGGPNSVSDAFERALRPIVRTTRVTGADRFEVSVNVNKPFISDGEVGTVYLASGVVFADALSGGTLAASDRAPVYAVPQNCVPYPVLVDLEEIAPIHIVLLGGVNTLGAGVASLQPC